MERKGRYAAAAAFAVAAVAANRPGWLAAASAQANLRQHVQRQLGQQPEGQQPPTGRPGRPNLRQPRGEPGLGQEIAEEDFKKITEAKSVDELMDLGKTFALSQKQEAAIAVIDKIIARDPKLLEDAARQRPKVWNDLWFSERAKKREKKLTPKDAAGRVKLAVWLNDAGLTAQARELLTAALAIDKNEPTAKELAGKWNIYSGGPIRFDLTMGLKDPLVVPTIQDEGQTVSTRAKEHVYLILPVAYNAGGQRLMINKGDLKAVGDDGKTCSVVGMALLERSDATGGYVVSTDAGALLADRGRVPELKMPASGNEPLWEQITVQPAERDKPQELSVMNTIHPFIRPQPGQRGQPPPPQPRPAGPLRETRPGTGYFAYIIDIPESLKALDCSYKSDAQIQLDLEFLQALGKPLDKLQPAERDRLVQTLAAQVTAKSAPVASAALRKLDAIRLAVGKGTESAVKASPAVAVIEKAMLAAFGHESPQVRRDGFDLLSKQSSEELSKRVSQMTDAAALANLVGEVQTYLADLRAAKAAAEAASQDSGAPNPAQAPPAEPTDTGLPRWPLDPGVVDIVLGCLNCGQAGIRSQALDVCLANPTDRLVLLLGLATNETVGELLTRAPKIEDPKVKAAVFRVLVGRSDKKLLPQILTAFGDVKIAIEKDTDPILEAAVGSGSAPVQLLELLAKADLSAVRDTEKCRKLVEKYSAEDLKPDKAVQEALVKLAVAQMKGGYEAPVKRSGGSSGQRGGADFEALLAAVAAGPNSNPQAARQAAAAMLSMGRARALNDRLQRLQGDARDKRVCDLIENLSRDKSLWDREALPAFLGMQLAGTDQRSRQLAISALSAIQSGTDPKQRWRVNLAIKQVVDAKKLIDLSLDNDETTSRKSLALLKNLAVMTAAEAAQFEVATDEGTRQDHLSVFEQERSSKAVGAFACMVYVDIRPNPVVRPGKALVDVERNSVPLPSVQVNIQRTDKEGQAKVFADGVQIGPPETRGQGQPTPSPGSIQIDAGPLLRKALGSADAQKEGLAGKIDLGSMRAVQICELKYEQLGAWGAELTIQDSPDSKTSSEAPLKVASVKILLEPTTR